MQVHRLMAATFLAVWFLGATLCSAQSGNLVLAADNDDLYPSNVDANMEIQQALTQAAKDRKHVLLVFGANWCYDCHVLDKQLASPQVAPVLNKNYEVVNVNVGRGGKNRDITDRYEVAINHGIPALTVLDANGKILFTQRHSEFVDARNLSPEDLLEFLNKWKP
ncbi:MAG TPA: thioredoxin family protein [Terriglobales bacterium]